MIQSIAPYGIRNLRSSHKILLKTAKSNSTKFEKLFVFKSVKHWNMLPVDLKKIQDSSQFATRLKQEMLQGKIKFPSKYSTP